MTDPNEIRPQLSGEAFSRTLDEHFSTAAALQNSVNSLSGKVGKLEGLYEGYTTGRRLTWISAGVISSIVMGVIALSISIASLVVNWP